MAENEVETIRVVDKKDRARGPLLMNKKDYEGQKEQFDVWEDPGGVTMNNMPVGVDPEGRNTSGTYSTPTPSDIRYPDKDATEFENNHGAFVAKDAASMRDVAGMPDEPGGIVNEDLTPEQPDGGVGESLVAKGKDKDGKETKRVVLEGLSKAEVEEYKNLKDDKVKRGQWVSQKMALAKARRRAAPPPKADAKPAPRPGTPAPHPPAPGAPPRPPGA